MLGAMNAPPRPIHSAPRNSALRPDERPLSPRRRALLTSAVGLSGIGGALALPGCGGGTTDSHIANLRFVNGTVDYASADFYVGSNKVFSGLANGGDSTGYGSANSGSQKIALNPTGSSTAAISDSHVFASDSITTVLAYGSLATALAFAYYDESDPSPASGAFSIRAFQASPLLTGVDIFISNASSLAGVAPSLSLPAYVALSDYISLAIGLYRVRITARGDTGKLLFDFPAGINVASGAVISLAVVPRASGSLPNVSVLPEGGTALRLQNALA